MGLRRRNRAHIEHGCRTGRRAASCVEFKFHSAIRLRIIAHCLIPHRPPVFSFNLGNCVYDDAGIDEVLRKMEADYNEEEYDFFFRNCNHFADDLGRRLSGGNEVDRKFMEDYVIFESESLLCNMASFQRSMTMAVTRQIQKIVIVSWRRSWKRALAEEAEASKVTT